MKLKIDEEVFKLNALFSLKTASSILNLVHHELRSIIYFVISI